MLSFKDFAKTGSDEQHRVDYLTKGVKHGRRPSGNAAQTAERLLLVLQGPLTLNSSFRDVPTGRYVFWRLVCLCCLMQVTSTFWVITQPLPTAERTTIPHLKEERQGFHMNPIAEI